jgi:hypothetical protein
VHGEGIVYGIKALEIAARTDAFSATFTIDYAALTDKENLFSYDAVVLNNTTHLKAKDNPALVPNLIEFVTSGRGLCVIHAGADNFYDSPVAARNGRAGNSRPPVDRRRNVGFQTDEPAHPSTAPSAARVPFRRRDLPAKVPFTTAPNCVCWFLLTCLTQKPQPQKA